jgi:hypothetical protein
MTFKKDFKMRRRMSCLIWNRKYFPLAQLGGNMIKGTAIASFVNVNSWNILIKSLQKISLKFLLKNLYYYVKVFLKILSKINHTISCE